MAAHRLRQERWNVACWAFRQTAVEDGATERAKERAKANEPTI